MQPSATSGWDFPSTRPDAPDASWSSEKADDVGDEHENVGRTTPELDRVRSSVRGYEMQACAMSAEKLEEKPRSSWFATVAPSVLLGLLVLELYQQGSKLRCIPWDHHRTVDLQPGVAYLCFADGTQEVQRSMSRLLKPAVDMVDSQIACVFIPYIVAVPISRFRQAVPSGLSGSLRGRTPVHHVHGRAFSAAGGVLRRASDVERCEIESEELDADELAAKAESS